MKKRIIAGVLSGMLLLETLTGCGKTDTGKKNVQGSEEESTILTGTSEGTQQQGAEVTALSLMQQYNTAEQQSTDDNYNTYYEVFVYSFYDSDGDGIGDLKGLTEKLDYINDGDDTTTTDLGCNGIWLMPVMPSATYHKYDVIDYYDIDPEYGTLDDFKVFAAECEKRGIRVMLDLVMNHSSSQHEWFLTACEYLRGLPEGEEPDINACPYVDYYNFTKEQKTGYSPVSGTDWYYEAQFWSEMPDLNLGSEAVRAEFEAIVDYWLDLGVSDFRLDAAKEFYSGEDEKNIEVLTWFCDMVKAKNEDAFIVAEVWTDIGTYANYYESGVSCFDFSFADTGGVIAEVVNKRGISTAKTYANRIISAQETFAQKNPDYIDAPFYTNHDIARSAGYYSGDDAESKTKIAQAMNLFMSGSAFLYYGEELGMKGSGKDENKRAPMYWSKDETAEGMCVGPADMEEVLMKYDSFAEQESDGNSIYNYVKQTILLRNQYPALSHGTAEKEEALMSDSVCALKKTYEDEEVLLIYNISSQSVSVDLSAVTGMEKEGVELELGGVLLTEAEDILLEGTKLTLPPYTVVVLQ